MNPASMSANRSTLPRQFYKYCIYHRDLKYTLNELFLTAGQILCADSKPESKSNTKANSETKSENGPETKEESKEELKDKSKEESKEELKDKSKDELKDKSKDESGQNTNQILDLFEYSYNSYQKTSIPFSLRDVLKVAQIMNNGNNLSLETALWMVFACRYEELERKEIEKILRLEDTLKVDIVKQYDQCIVRGYWDIETQQKYSEYFKAYCFTSTEKVTIFKLSLALQSKRAILVYGSSPSGKS